MTITNIVTLYVIRAIKDHVNKHDPMPLVQFDRGRPYEFRAGWYVAREFTKDKFSQAKFFDSQGKASSYLKQASTISTHYDRNPSVTTPRDKTSYFEIVPVEICEPK